MNLQRKLKVGLLALAIVLVAAAVPANAQQIYKATFTLPFEAQWGNTVVEPGDYSITVEDALGQKVIRLHGPRRSRDIRRPGHLRTILPTTANWCL